MVAFGRHDRSRSPVLLWCIGSSVGDERWLVQSANGCRRKAGHVAYCALCERSSVQTRQLDEAHIYKPEQNSPF